MIEPLRLSFDADAPQEHAFETWTDGIDHWWPPDHTQTGEPDHTIRAEATEVEIRFEWAVGRPCCRSICRSSQ